MRQKTQRFWRRTGAIGVACLLFFAGVANAYCSIDEGLPHSGSSVASGAALSNVADPDHDAVGDVCEGPPPLDEEYAPPLCQWDGAVSTPQLHWAVVLPVRVAAYVTPRRHLVLEPVFKRFPRLLI